MMHISRVDLNLFIVFEAIYAEGSVTRARTHHLTLKTLLRISVRHWFTARWVPAAANDDFDSGVPA